MRWVVTLVFLPLILASRWPNGEPGHLLEIARERMRCTSDSKCLEESGIQRLLRTENLKDANPEDLSIVLAHHLLHGESSCTTLISRLDIVEEEVMRAIGTEDIPGILRIFRRILKDGGEAECIGIETILREISPSSHTFTPLQWLRSVLGVLMEQILKGKCINASTSSEDSLDDIFKRYGEACSPYLTAKGIEKVMHDLESAGNNHDHHHHHHHHSHGHHHFGDHSHHHECDQHGSEHHHHDYTGPYHGDHDHNNHYHSDHNHNNHSSDHLHNYSHHNFSKPSNYDFHNHSSHEHDNQYLSAHDLNNHKNSKHYHSNHDHYEHDHDNHNHSDVDRHHSMDAKNKHLNNITYDASMHNISSEKDMKDNPMKDNPMNLENANKTNYTEFDVLANNTFEVSADSLMALNGNGSEYIESILPSGINNLWQPTTISSEEASNTILPLNTHSRVPFSQCVSAETLVSQFGYDRVTISKAEFLNLCPVLVQQAVGDGCEERAVQSFLPSKLEVYGYGSACVFVLCLASLSGVFLLPLMRRNARHYVIAGFQGLAFSTLASDALLHLIPEFLGLHSHNPSQSHSYEHASFPEPYAQLLLGVFATTYVLFMMEAVLCAISGRSHDNSGHGHTHVHHISEPTLISIKSESASQLPISGDQSCSSLDTEIVEMETAKKPPNLMVSQPVLCGLTSVAIVVTVGDALHNFGDGLAIGASFSANIRGGLSTTAAAFCHELPHELGDFVVLLSTGLSFSRALLLNFLSGLTCFGGLYVGILVGDNEVARKWVMAVTASTFLYVALAEMVPELREHRHGTPFKMLLVKNIGIIAGIAIMCVISVYEHEMG